VGGTVLNQRERDKADTRQRIVEAALALFREQGYAQTSMGQIATAAGTSRANLYLHFGSKPLIVKERMMQLEPEVVRFYDQLESLPDYSPDSLREWLLVDRRMYGEHPAEYEAISAAMAVETEVLQEWIGLHRRIIENQEWLTRLFPDPGERELRRVHLATLMMSTERIFDVVYLRHQAGLDEELVLTSLARQWSALFQA
jgi:AcrR family transcriptional regulator